MLRLVVDSVIYLVCGLEKLANLVHFQVSNLYRKPPVMLYKLQAYIGITIILLFCCCPGNKHCGILLTDDCNFVCMFYALVYMWHLCT